MATYEAVMGYCDFDDPRVKWLYRLELRVII